VTEIRLATGPVSWGIDFADSPGNPPWEQVLDEIERSGVGAMELGPVGYLPEDPATLQWALRQRGLTAVGTFVFDDFHDAARGGTVTELTRRTCQAISAVGGDVLVLIDRPSPERIATAGRSDAAPRLSGAAWHAMTAAFLSAAEIAREYGIRPVLHPHAGGYVEFQDEIDQIMEQTDLDMCLDTGHLAYARIDPVAAVDRYGSRLGHVHLKDVTQTILDRITAERLDFWAAVQEGIFCPLGKGVVDIDAILTALERHGYAGFATIEQDRVPGQGTPLADLRRSIRVIGSMSR
jgi:inosose dehydratase